MKKRKWILLLIPVFVAIAITMYMTVTTPNSEFRSPLKSKTKILNNTSNLENFITEEMKKNEVLGLSVAIIYDNEIIYQKGFGYQDNSSNIAVNNNTIFETASLSKPVTAYLALMLVEQEKMSLDEPLSHYLDKAYLQDKENADKITLRMILNHTSGMENDPDGIDRSIQFEPGTRFLYSGGGFKYLQVVLESITKMPLDELAEENILKPLKMEHSSYRYRDEFSGSIAYGSKKPHELSVNAAYSLLSTPTDMGIFINELLYPTLLKEETVRIMKTPSVDVRKDVSWGLGIGIQHSQVGNAIWQWGNNDNTYHSFFVAFEENNSGIIVMTNSPGGKEIIKEIANVAIGGFHLSYMDVIP
ncbi:beta-lactamase family protein [Armatimonadetes bacterium]|nr:beta-lactamase family protein [bacterium]